MSSPLPARYTFIPNRFKFHSHPGAKPELFTTPVPKNNVGLRQRGWQQRMISMSLCIILTGMLYKSLDTYLGHDK